MDRSSLDLEGVSASFGLVIDFNHGPHFIVSLVSLKYILDAVFLGPFKIESSYEYPSQEFLRPLSVIHPPLNMRKKEN